jgi:GT2 family glycosyltransferase
VSQGAQGGANRPTVSVVIPAFLLERWGDLQEAVASVREQTAPALETVVVIDHQPELLSLAQRRLNGARVIPNKFDRGASGARNSGVAESRGEVVAFLDDDAVASADWLTNILPHFDRAEVVGVGGGLQPWWATARPRWFPDEFNWAIGASYVGMPTSATAVRNVWSGNMAIRREIFDQIGGFRLDFGKVGPYRQPEDTDLCMRAAKARQNGLWLYEPTAIAAHRVPADRATFRYFLRRTYLEGTGKAALAGHNGVRNSTSVEFRYALLTCSLGLVRGLGQAVTGDASGIFRSLALVAGLSSAAAGFIVGSVARTVGARNNPRATERERGELAHTSANSR